MANRRARQRLVEGERDAEREPREERDTDDGQPRPRAGLNALSPRETPVPNPYPGHLSALRLEPSRGLGAHPGALAFVAQHVKLPDRDAQQPSPEGCQ